MIKRFFLSLLFVFLSLSVFAQEQLTVTTYYPSPYGVYKKLRLFPNTDHNEGDMCSNSGEVTFSNDRMLYCDETGVWQALTGYWKKQGSDIYNIDFSAGGKVGIGVDTPQALLDIAGDGAMLIPRTDNDPAGGVEGMIYYNTSMKRFRAYEEGAWKDLIVVAPPSTMASSVYEAGVSCTSNACRGGAVYVGCSPSGSTLCSVVGNAYEAGPSCTSNECRGGSTFVGCSPSGSTMCATLGSTYEAGASCTANACVGGASFVGCSPTGRTMCQY